MNQAAMMTSVKRIEIQDIPMPVIKDDEVMIKIEYVGICGSDLHFYESGMRKGKKFDLPLILGHESVGTVVKTGEKVKNLKIGDRVAIEPQLTCGKCEYCKSGRYNLCADVIFPSVPPYDGMLRKYFSFPAHLCYKIPEGMPTKIGALVEPMAVGFQAARCAEVEIGKTIVIFGMGTMGLTTLLACKLMGAENIIAVDLYENRINTAAHFGASATVNASKEDMQEKVLELTGGKGADIVFETAGSKVTTTASGRVLKRGGVIVIVGNVHGMTQFDFMDLMYKEGQIRTIYRYRNNFNMTINAMMSILDKLDYMITDIYDFSNTQDAFCRNLENKKDVIKTLIKIH